MAPSKKRLTGFLDKKIGSRKELILKPVFNCPVCMSSVWGTLYYCIGIKGSVLMYPVYLIMLAGLVFFIMLLGYNDPREHDN